MPDSPLRATPYEVLGVSPSASDGELRRAFRRKLREVHPDTGGAAAQFHAVQRAWELIGTPAARAEYDRATSQPSHAPRPEPRRRADHPQARSYGHPGGRHRELFLEHMREWVGRGSAIDNLYEPRLVRSAPPEIRHLLAAAVAEEEAARLLAPLGLGFTLWHDVASAAGKVDHIVLGPTGLWAVLSEDWGAPVRIRKGELIGQGLESGERPMHELSLRARSVAREARVRFTALVIAVPDDAADESLAVLGSMRGATTLLVQRSRLPGLMRGGVPGVAIGGTDLFEVRTRLQASLRFV